LNKPNPFSAFLQSIAVDRNCRTLSGARLLADGARRPSALVHGLSHVMAALVAAIHADPRKASRDSRAKQPFSIVAFAAVDPFVSLWLRLVDGRVKPGQDAGNRPGVNNPTAVAIRAFLFCANFFISAPLKPSRRATSGSRRAQGPSRLVSGRAGPEGPTPQAT
jgi:hypothetical protein